MFKSDEEIDALLNKEDNLATVISIPKPAPRRQLNDLSERREIRDIVPEGHSVVEDDDEEPEITNDTTTIRPLHNGGRRPGDNNIPHKLRVEIALAARTQPIAVVAERYGISEHHAFELSKGMTSYEDGKNAKLIDDINSQVSVPHELALARLTAVLTAITPEKISRVSKVKDLAQIASQLAGVSKSVQPIVKDDPIGTDGSAQLVVYAPSFKQENHYETVRVERSPVGI
jgi:hypothetical protein